ncbi:alpha/beta hydrolase [Alkalicoccobacillus murimartini]|uniref:Acetyl esterase n=1 Tax=Alkalicoccobacillus murimartini TaxID=171685 RepID=A0ABT9YF05_9BACI|nr:alpha/beta hydrolase [Alkalicoccobacillus murimartini]MDQ0206203.1 acetyl esterase [Alkalicoccobacillus murimartini]
MKAFFRKGLVAVSIFLLGVVMIMLTMTITVQAWTHTEAGKVPVKTAVILHAVSNNLLPSDLKAPKFLAAKGSSRFDRSLIDIPTADGQTVKARVYQPKESGPHPVILYFHGGAFMKGYGNIDTHDNIVRSLAAKTNSVVISVEYRLAPDYPFPTAILDGYDALNWAHDHIDELEGDINNIAVVGDSSGGNVATAVALMARDNEGPAIKAEALLYPLTTFLDDDFVSRDLYSSGYYLLSRDVMELARKSYTPEEEMWVSPYSSPLEADLVDMPQTLVITAEFDPLRDEGEAYAQRLSDAGVPVQATRYNGVMHGFASFFEVMQSGKQSLNETASFLNAAFEDQLINEPYELAYYDHGDLKSSLRDEIEAYTIGTFLVSKQALSMFPFTFGD